MKKTENIESIEKLRDLITQTLDDMKVVEPVVIDVRGRSSLTDYIIIGSGTSGRHVSAMGEKVIEAVKHAGFDVPHVEGLETAGWVLLDCYDVILHLFQPDIRAFYRLEQLWSTALPGHAAAEA